jgi:hypothetical protein
VPTRWLLTITEEPPQRDLLVVALPSNRRVQPGGAATRRRDDICVSEKTSRLHARSRSRAPAADGRKLGAKQSLPRPRCSFARMSGVEGKREEKYGATRGLGKKGESAISSRTANLCSLGCIFVLPIQRGSSSLFDLGPASRKRPRSFLGHVDWAFPPTRHSATATDWDATAQRSRTVNSHSLHCVHICLGQPERTTNCWMGTKTGSGG